MLATLAPPPTVLAETATLEPTMTATIAHVMRPGNGARAETSIWDTISGTSARQGQPNQPPGGDQYPYNEYERPFNAITQDIFFPDLDIHHAEIGLGDPWMYVTLYQFGLRPETQILSGTYGVELDLDIDGNGEFLIEASAPLQSEWVVEGVRVWHDTNADVGGDAACYADPPQVEDSYDQLLFDQGLGDDPDAAWARMLPTDPKAVQLAFKHSVIELDKKFMWWVWADQGVNQPQWFDYHDHYTYDEAGSPFTESSYYPIKAIAEVDNTCHWTYGFKPTGDEPCLCAGGRATATPTATKVLERASLAGYVYKDLNKNGERDEGDGGFGGVTVVVREGACPGGDDVASTTTGAFGVYSVGGLEPGTYCVTVSSGSLSFDPMQRTVHLGPGEHKDNINFRWVPSIP